MAFTHETKPKIKKRVPIINMEMKVSLFVNEPASTTAVIDFAMNLNYRLVVSRLELRSAAEDSSRYNVQLAWNCRILAGFRLLTGSSRQFFTVSAFLLSGTEHIICFDFNICWIGILIACFGTASNDSNHPSPSCCFRQASSN